MRPDEKQFLIQFYKRAYEVEPKLKMVFGMMLPDRISPRELINEPDFPIHYKRAWYLLSKWADKGWYEWGVTMDLGWLTEEGKQKARELMGNGVQD